jgi:hypothetical protein
MSQLNSSHSPFAQTQTEVTINRPPVDPIMPPLPVERWFRIRGQFVFGLPRNFALPSPEIAHAWEGRNGAALLCVEDSAAGDYAMFLMIQSARELTSEPVPSLWLMLADELKRKWPPTMVRGPEPILVGGEESIRFDLSGVDDGIDTRQCVAWTRHRGEGYSVTMFVKAYAQPTYEPAFLTVLGSWGWAE